MNTLNVVLVKPSKYGLDGYVERFRKGYLPNATLPYMRSLTPSSMGGVSIRTVAIDEYVHTNLDYLRHLHAQRGERTLVAIVGAQSHQFQRALDLADFAVDHGCQAIIGGPHPMTCDTSMLQGQGVSFALSEAENVWPQVISDAIAGELQPVYGVGQRWATRLPGNIILPPTEKERKHYLANFIVIYPSRGCPYTCNFCSVIMIAGRRVRSQPVESTIESLRMARDAGIKLVIFCSDNFNKYPEVDDLLDAMIEEELGMRFFCQCDAQISREPQLVEKLARAGCYQMFVGVESFNRRTLLGAHKAQNQPKDYHLIAELCRKHHIDLHCSNILGFPSDTRKEILEHVEYLKDLSPSLASFYILTPIPGTEQYSDFKRQGLIYEDNLDRFDGTRPTWHHPNLSPRELIRLFQVCYQRFYASWHVKDILKQFDFSLPFAVRDLKAALGYTFYARWAAFRETHPMAGGFWKINLDHVSQYLENRRTRFGYRLVPLPNSLQLSEADAASNRLVNISLVNPATPA